MTDTISIPRELLESLAPRNPPHDAYYDNCFYCGDLNDSVSRDPASHHPDCAWVKARKLLGDDFSDLTPSLP